MSNDLPARLTVPLPRQRNRPLNPLWRRRLKSLALPLLIVIALEIIVRVGWLPSYQMPAPSEVAVTLTDLAEGALWKHIGASLIRVLIGFAIGASLALAFAAWVGLSREAEAYLEPTFAALRSIPSLAWVPLLLLWLGPQQLAHGAQVLAVRIWPAQDYTRLTIESDSELKARQFFVADPPRLAIDIEGVDLAPSLRELVRQVKSDDPNVSGIRVGQNAPNVVRLVVDLKKPITPQVFSLPPVASYQNRLVVDLYPTQAIDPLDELIQQRLGHIESTLAAGPAATGSGNPSGATANDPLGELIRDRVAQANQPKPPAPVPNDTTVAAPANKPPRRPGGDGDTATAKAVGAEAWVSAGLRVAVMEITKNP